MHYRLTYLCNGYTLADAFRPDHRWGKRIFNLGPFDCSFADDEVIDYAKKTPPANHYLNCIEAIGGEPHVRVIFTKLVPGAQKLAEALSTTQAQQGAGS